MRPRFSHALRLEIDPAKSGAPLSSSHALGSSRYWAVHLCSDVATLCNILGQCPSSSLDAKVEVIPAVPHGLSRVC